MTEMWAIVRVDHFQAPGVAQKGSDRALDLIAIPRLFLSRDNAMADATRLSGLQRDPGEIEYFARAVEAADEAAVLRVDHPFVVVGVDGYRPGDTLRRENIHLAYLVASEVEAAAIVRSHSHEPSVWGYVATRWRRSRPATPRRES